LLIIQICREEETLDLFFQRHAVIGGPTPDGGDNRVLNVVDGYGAHEVALLVSYLVDHLSCHHPGARTAASPSFETLATLAPQDEVPHA
jgi:hypothetical protein